MRCTRCLNELPIDSFALHRKSNRGRQSWCTDCTTEHQRQYRITERGRHNRLKRLYGITAQTFDEMVEATGSTCQICSNQSKPGKAGLVLDHDHRTGKVRGILCGTCNRLLGWYEKRRDAIEEYMNAS